MRRGLGAAAIVKQRERTQRMGELGEKLDANRIENAREHLETFKKALTDFALKYRSRIQEDPIFREQFVSMCDLVGVDPIQVSKNSTSWLGGILGMGEFYSDLAVQILTQCMLQRKSSYGPLLPVTRCMELIQAQNISVDDIRRSVGSLEVFGSGGVRVVSIAGEIFISSLPEELNSDSAAVLASYKSKEGLTLSRLSNELSWPDARTLHAVLSLVREGVLWTDVHGGVTTYWLISLWLKN